MTRQYATMTKSPPIPDPHGKTTDFADMWPRILPFAAYMSFLAISAGLGEALGNADGTTQFINLWLYPIKTVIVGGLLVFIWSRCEELAQPVFKNMGEAALAAGVGILVYVLWVHMDWPWAMQGEAAGYNPFVASGAIGLVLAGTRIFGASIVVPVMEELFWRSFLIRYIINARFKTVALGTFSLASFALTVILFGLEHHLWLAGMMAGAAYNFLLYQTRRLWPCIVAHGVTNLILGFHVLATGEWQWW